MRGVLAVSREIAGCAGTPITHSSDILLDFSPSDFMLNETKILNEMNIPLAAVGLGERSSPHQRN